VRVPAILLLFSLGAQAEWTQWRGPNRDGQASQLEAPAEWPEELTRVWKIDGVGSGYAGPLVQGESIYLHSRDEATDEEVVTKRRLSDGGVVWEQRYRAPYKPTSAAAPHGLGPKSTPVLDDGRLFTLGISGVLSAFDAASGKVLWRKDFQSEFERTWPKFGVAMSPAIVHGKLVAHVGTDKDGALIAFDPATGKEAWRWSDEGPSYVSPVVFRIDGREQIVTQSAEHTVSVDAETGEELWSLPFTTPYTQNIMTPVMVDDLILFSGTRAKSSAVRAKSDGGKWTAEEVWTTNDATMYMSSPVLHEGVLYGYTEKQRGNLFAMDPKTGEVHWRGPGRLGHNATLIAADGYLLTLTSDAELIVTRLGADAYEPLRTYSVADAETYGHPAVAGAKHLLIKDDRALTLWTW